MTPEYALLQASFWMGLCVFMSFAAVYLQYLGYTNTELGIVAAAGTLTGSLLAPVLSSQIDRRAEVTASATMPYIIAAESVVIIVLMLFPFKGVITSVFYSLYMAFATMVNTPILKIYADAAHSGVEMDFAKARGIGSLGYVIASFILGRLVEQTSPAIIPFAGLVVAAVQASAFYNLKRKLPSHMESGIEEEQGSDLATFLRRYPRFGVLLFGIVLVYFCHNTLCNFMINVVRGVGGDTGDMGFINGLMALVEIPVMLAYTRLTRSRNTVSVLRFSLIAFIFKGMAVAASSTVPQLAAAQFLQAPSFAIYAGAIVEYVDESLPHEDSAKAQSLAFTMTMVGSVLAGMIAGRLFDNFSSSTTLWISAIVSAIGSLIAIKCLKENEGRERIR